MEPGEIEAALAALPGIAAAAVNLSPEGVLQAFLVPDGIDAGGTDHDGAPFDLAPHLDLAALRARARAVLPEHMTPQLFAGLRRLPMTVSGKLDRRALPALTAEGAPLARPAHIAPRTPTEAAVATAMADLLGLPEVGLADDFFALGGHSLMALRLAARLEATLARPLPLRTLFDHTTIEALAAAIDGTAQGASDLDLVAEDVAQVAELGHPVTGTAAALEEAGTILLTGATGFVGGYLLRDLLRGTKARVVALVRARDAEAGAARLLAGLSRIMPEGEVAALRHRLVCLPGDIAAPGLGLAPDARARLAQEVDIILHNGAMLNMLAGYRPLRDANTRSLLPLIEIMTEGRPKTLHFVSTLAVLHDEGTELTAMPAADDLPPPDLGYALSKWAAERMIAAGRARGFDLRILRLGAVIGDSVTGAYPAQDATNAFLRLCHDLRAVPDRLEDLPWAWTPVDLAAQRILRQMRQGPDAPHLSHVHDGAAIPSGMLRDAFAAAGRPAGGWTQRAGRRRRWPSCKPSLTTLRPG